MRRVAVLAADLILPAAARAEGSISALSVFPSSVRDGASAVGTVTLIPDAGPTTVNLYSSDPSLASVATSVAAAAATTWPANLRLLAQGLPIGVEHGGICDTDRHVRPL